MHETRRQPSLPIRLALGQPWRVAIAWILLVVASLAVVATLLGGALNNEQANTNNPESVQGFTLLDEHFDDTVAVQEVVVVASRKHQVNAPEFQAFVRRLAEVAPRVGVTLAGGGAAIDADQLDTRRQPGAEGGPPVSRDGRALLVPIAYISEDHEAAARRLVDAVHEFDRHADFEVDVTGEHTMELDLTELSERDLREGELHVGLPAAMLVLLLVFGTLVGAILPLIIAAVSIITALALTALVGQVWELNLFVVNMISGMGLALGIDYSLFVVSRYREERSQGSARDAAIRTTGATASRAVLFSGITFVVALTGMLLIPTTVMRSLAAGAILVGITAVIAALTLLPALLRLLGDRIEALPVPLLGRRAARSGDGRHGFWPGLVRRVMRRPVLWGGTVAVVLAAASLPLLDMETGASGVGTFPDDLTSRQGYLALREHFPGEAFAPTRIAIHEADGFTTAGQQVEERIRDELAEDDRFGSVQRTASEDGELVELAVSVGADALSSTSVAAVRELRAEIVPPALEGTKGVEVLVTGETALHIDYFDVMSQWLLPVLGFVLGLSFLILLVVFRSIVVPAVAILLNLLSVGATYGLLVLVFQHGVGAELLGFRQVDTTEAWVPLFLFSVLFGLSMDYHMFLLTRIRERYSHTDDTAEAVAWGVGSTGRIITGAALIIVAVFAGFAVGDLVMFQQMGFGIAVALLLDATLVRGVLLPAAMALLGGHNWYLPGWLAFLPEVQLEEEPSAPSDRVPA